MTDTIKTLLQPIQNRLNAATKLGEWEVRGKDVVIYDKHGYGAYRIVAWVDHPEYTEPIAAAPTDQARLLAAVQAAADLHQHAFRNVEPWARGYKYSGDHCGFDGEEWPCATIAAIESALTEAS